MIAIKTMWGLLLAAAVALGMMMGLGEMQKSDPPSAESNVPELNPMADSLAFGQATAPPDTDTLGWIDWHNPVYEVGIADAWGVGKNGAIVGFLSEKRFLIACDTSLSASCIHPRMRGEIRFDWEPVYMPNDKSQYNIIGIQSFEMNDRAGKPHLQWLHGLIETEAYHTVDSESIEAKEVRFVDINLDGYADLCLETYPARCGCFLFDPAEGVFQSKIFGPWGYPVLDVEKGLVHSYRGGTAAGAEFEVFAYQNDTHQFVPRLRRDTYLEHVRNPDGTENGWSITTYFDLRANPMQLLRADSVQVSD
jgi:hypothetical protein